MGQGTRPSVPPLTNLWLEMPFFINMPETTTSKVEILYKIKKAIPILN